MVSYEFPVKLVAMDDNPVIEEAVKRFPELSYVRKKIIYAITVIMITV